MRYSALAVFVALVLAIGASQAAASNCTCVGAVTADYSNTLVPDAAQDATTSITLDTNTWQVRFVVSGVRQVTNGHVIAAPVDARAATTVAIAGLTQTYAPADLWNPTDGCSLGPIDTPATSLGIAASVDTDCLRTYTIEYSLLTPADRTNHCQLTESASEILVECELQLNTIRAYDGTALNAILTKETVFRTNITMPKEILNGYSTAANWYKATLADNATAVEFLTNLSSYLGLTGTVASNFQYTVDTPATPGAPSTISFSSPGAAYDALLATLIGTPLSQGPLGIVAGTLEMLGSPRSILHASLAKCSVYAAPLFYVDCRIPSLFNFAPSFAIDQSPNWIIASSCVQTNTTDATFIRCDLQAISQIYTELTAVIGATVLPSGEVMHFAVNYSLAREETASATGSLASFVKSIGTRDGKFFYGNDDLLTLEIEAFDTTRLQITQLELFNSDSPVQTYNLRTTGEFELVEAVNATYFTLSFYPARLLADSNFYRNGPHGVNVSFEFTAARRQQESQGGVVTFNSLNLKAPKEQSASSSSTGSSASGMSQTVVAAIAGGALVAVVAVVAGTVMIVKRSKSAAPAASPSVAETEV